MRKQVDARVRALIEASAAAGTRSLFVVVGDKARDAVVHLHYMQARAAVRARPTVLWCYKSELYLSSHKRKRAKQVKKLASKGLLNTATGNQMDGEDPFALFVASTSIRYCYYTETHRILGSTYGMLVLQDFESLTPNLLARTVETVSGGGSVVLLLSRLDSLTQLYTMAMDCHARFRTEAFGSPVARFNERFLLSLAQCDNCLVLDDELNMLPISVSARAAQMPGKTGDNRLAARVDESAKAREAALSDVVNSLADAPPAGELAAVCKTADQANALAKLLDAASEKTRAATVAVTAARGRGKSASLGLAIAGAIALGYSNIFVTAPSPENLRTLFQFIAKGLDALGYAEHTDYSLSEAAMPSMSGGGASATASAAAAAEAAADAAGADGSGGGDGGGADTAGEGHRSGGRASTMQACVIRLDVFRAHRQTVRYVAPQHADRIRGAAELLVIDEAAAIPLPVVKSLFGPYLLFLASTVNGYEGTGRALSMKLLAQLREASTKGGSGARALTETSLSEPIRYAPGDGVETWLNRLLLLDTADAIPPAPAQLPHPSECELWEVDRDTLFSGHRAAEEVLRRCWSLYVAAHYRNTPNDLQLLSDAPAHRIFALLGPVAAEGASTLPDVLCVLQVALEGRVSRQSAMQSLRSGVSPSGDMIPYTILTQFQDSGFAQLSGARIVRVAVHPGLQRGGYGSRAVELLSLYCAGDLYEGPATDNDGGDTATLASAASPAGQDVLRSERPAPRQGLPPLLHPLAHRSPPGIDGAPLHYVGCAFGLSRDLLSFWRRSSFEPLYVRQSASELTGEHTCIAVRALACSDLDGGGDGWLVPMRDDFRARVGSLLGGTLKDLSSALALSLVGQPAISNSKDGSDGAGAPWKRGGEAHFSARDLARLRQYASSLADRHLILDLVPALARMYFGGEFGDAHVSVGQAALLVAVGLQMRPIEDAAEELALPVGQAMALFNKTIRRFHGVLRERMESRVAKDMGFVRTLPGGETDDVDAKAPAAGDVGADGRRQLSAYQRRTLGTAEEIEAQGLGVPESAAAHLASSGVVPRVGGLVSVPRDEAKAKKRSAAAEGSSEKKRKKKEKKK